MSEKERGSEKERSPREKDKERGESETMKDNLEMVH